MVCDADHSPPFVLRTNGFVSPFHIYTFIMWCFATGTTPRHTHTHTHTSLLDVEVSFVMNVSEKLFNMS